MTYERSDWWETLSPIRDMAYRGAYDAMQHLLAHKEIDVDIFVASIMGDLGLVQQMIETNPQLLSSATPDKHFLGKKLTPLHLAAQGGHTELAHWLLGQGADVNAKSHQDFTPLHLVIYCGKKQFLDPLPDVQDPEQGLAVYRLLTDMPLLLINNGADLTALSTDGLTPLALAKSPFDDETDRSDVIAMLETSS